MQMRNDSESPMLDLMSDKVTLSGDTQLKRWDPFARRPDSFYGLDRRRGSGPTILTACLTNQRRSARQKLA